MAADGRAPRIPPMKIFTPAKDLLQWCNRSTVVRILHNYETHKNGETHSTPALTGSQRVPAGQSLAATQGRQSLILQYETLGQQANKSNTSAT